MRATSLRSMPCSSMASKSVILVPSRYSRVRTFEVVKGQYTMGILILGSSAKIPGKGLGVLAFLEIVELLGHDP